MSDVTEDDIIASMTPAGGFTRATLAGWGVPWPAPKGWKKTILAYGIPYQPDMNTLGDNPAPPITEDGLRRMMADAKPQMVDGDPFDCVGELDIDPATLLRKVVTAVISYGHSDILWEFPEVLAFFGSRIPQREETAHLHNVDERMFEAADKWPNRIKSEPAQ